MSGIKEAVKILQTFPLEEQQKVYTAIGDAFNQICNTLMDLLNDSLATRERLDALEDVAHTDPEYKRPDYDGGDLVKLLTEWAAQDGMKRDVYGHQTLTRAAKKISELSARIALLAEAGTGYSQQTLDAVTKEREELRARLADEKKSCIEFAKGVEEMAKALDYVKGICDRGGYEGTDKEKMYVPLRILGYVKQLEAGLSACKKDRDEWRACYEAELEGNAKLRVENGAKDDETFIDFVLRLRADREKAIRELEVSDKVKMLAITEASKFKRLYDVSLDMILAKCGGDSPAKILMEENTELKQKLELAMDKCDKLEGSLAKYENR